MKFAFVSHVLPPSWSGQAVVIGRVLRGLPPDHYCLISRQAYDVNGQDDFTLRLPGRYFALPAEVQLRGSSRSTILAWVNAFARIWQRGRSIARVLKQEGCQSVVVGTGDVIDVPAAFLASRLAGVACYPYLFDDYTFQWPPGISRDIARWCESTIFKQVAGLIVPNEFLRDEILRRHGRSASLVRNPCESIDLIPEGERPVVRKSERRIVYTGAIYHINFKAFVNLLAALQEPDLAGVQLHLFTAQPSETLRAEGIASDQIVYRQHVPPMEVVQAQNSADILFVPFTLDSIVPEVVKTSAPGKFADYLASGTPILAHAPSDSFVSGYLREHDCGVVVDQDDPRMLANAVRQLLADDVLRRRLSRNARARARIDFDPVKAQGSFLKALEPAG